MATWKLLGELERPVVEHLWSSSERQTVLEAHAAMSTRRTGRPRVYISSTGLGARTYVRCSECSWKRSARAQRLTRMCRKRNDRHNPRTRPRAGADVEPSTHKLCALRHRQQTIAA